MPWNLFQFMTRCASNRKIGNLPTLAPMPSLIALLGFQGRGKEPCCAGVSHQRWRR
jgi:hypothetical protein